MSDQQDKEAVNAEFEKWSQSALVPKGFTIHDRLKHTWEAAFAAGRAAEREEKEKLEQQVATLAAENERLREDQHLLDISRNTAKRLADKIAALTAANERLTKIVEQGTPSRQDYFTAVKNRDGMMEKVLALTDALELAREALKFSAEGVEPNGYCRTCDECNSEDPCTHRKSFDTLAALNEPQGKALSGEAKGEGDLQAQYNELLYAVLNKWPNETRHQTALRYIREREAVSSGPRAQAAEQPKGEREGGAD